MSATQDLINSILVDLFNFILRLEEAHLQDRGVPLTMNEVHILEAVQKSEVTTMKEIAQRLNVTQGTLTTSVNRLVKKGYIKRFKIVEDKRKTLLGLTPEADDILKIHSEFHGFMVEKLINEYEIENQVILLQSLDNLKNFFYDLYK